LKYTAVVMAATLVRS